MIAITMKSTLHYKMEFKENETVAQLIQRFKTEQGVHFNGDAYTVQDTIVGREIPDEEIVFDNREYYLSAWLVPA